jgi:hypothetical protein
LGPRAGLDRRGKFSPNRISIRGPSSPHPVAIPTRLPDPRYYLSIFHIFQVIFLGIINNVDRVLYIQLISHYHVCSAMFLQIFNNSRPSEICGHQSPSAFGTGDDSLVILSAYYVRSFVTNVHAIQICFTTNCPVEILIF